MQMPQLVFIIDALDQLTQSELVEKFDWLPDYIPPNVTIAVSPALTALLCLQTYLIRHLRFVHYRRLIHPTSGTSWRAWSSISQVPLYGNQRSSDDSTAGGESLVSLDDVQRLIMLDSDDFKMIAELGDGMRGQKAFMFQIIHNAPKDLNGVCAMILDEAASRINEEQSRYILSLLAVSRNGLRESDIRAIFARENIPYNALDFSRFIKYMRPYFFERGNSRIDFTHKAIRMGFRGTISPQRTASLNHAIYILTESLPDTDALHKSGIHMVCLSLR